MAMQRTRLNAMEKRNLELVKVWIETFEKDSGAMVDKVYADSTEVFLPLQKLHMTKKDKTNWRAVEVANEKLYLSRKSKFEVVLARNNMVAVEVVSVETDLRGRQNEKRWAAFLTFNKDGRIVSDHTYMLNADKTPDPEKAKDPKIKQFMQVLKNAHQKVMKENGY